MKITHLLKILKLILKIFQVEIKFQIPKPDMRNPSEVEDFLRLFWTRKVHPEIYTLTLDAFNFRVEQEKG